MAGKITIEELNSALRTTIENKVDKNTMTTQLGTKINTSAIKNDLTTGGASNVLSAEQGKTLKGLVDGKASKSDLNSKINTSAIKDDLVTGGASNVLSAAQGVIIKGLIDALSEKIDAVGGGASGDIAELIASKVAKTDIINDLITGGETKVLSAEQGKTLKGLVDGKASKSELSGKADVATVTSQLNGKINTSAIKNDLTTGGASNVLSAEQGKTLKGLVDSLTSKVNGKADTGTVTSQLAGKVNTADIIDNLTSGGATKVLSAEQGVAIKALIDSLTTKVNTKANTTVASQTVNGLMAATDKKKLDGIATGANKYTHPTSHPASIITEDETHRFLTDTERELIQAWEGFKTNGGEIGGPLVTNRVERVIPTNTIEHGYGFGLALKSADGSDKLEIIIGNNADKKGIYPVQRMHLGTPDFAFSEIWGGNFLKGGVGYVQLQNNYFLQYGVIGGFANNSRTTIKYPIKFPNKVIGVFTQFRGDPDGLWTFIIDNLNETAFDLITKSVSGSTALARVCHWFVLGY